MALEDIEKKLYKSGAGAIKKTGDILYKGNPNEDVATEWQEDAPHEPERDWVQDVQTYVNRKTRKIMIAGFAFGGIVLFGILGYFLYQSLAYRGIDISINYPEQVLVGVPFDYKISFVNNSGSILKDAKLVVNLPGEMVFVGGGQDQRVETEDLGSIGTGSLGQRTFKVVAVKGNNSVKRVVSSMEYTPGALGSRTQKNTQSDISIGDSALSVDFTAANKVLSGESFEFKLNYKNISNFDLRDLELNMAYPPSFLYKTASLEPDSGNNVWRLEDLRAGSSNEIIVRGSIVATDNSFFEIKAVISSSMNGAKNSVNEKMAKIIVAPAPLSVSVALNNSTDYVAKTNDRLVYTLTYKNNSDVGFRDVIISAKLVGEMFDFSSIEQTTPFNSINNTLTWNASKMPDLHLLSPGGSGSVNFFIKTREQYPITRLSDKNFTVRAEATIESPTVPSYVDAFKTISIDKLETKISGQAVVQTLGFFRDAGSGILNKGPIPPTVNQPTNYTIHWIIKTYSTDVENVSVSASLMPGVRSTGVIKSNINTAPIYNERTQELSWTIPRIRATRGVIDSPIEAIIQVEALPYSNHVSAAMPIIGVTTLMAHDVFADQDIGSMGKAIDTNMLDDPTVGYENGRVIP